MKIKILLFGFGLALVFALSSFDNSEQSASPSSDYKKYCSSCHGEEMRTFINRKWLYGNSWNEVFNSIKYGNEDDGMPAYSSVLTDKAIRELTDYILKGIERKTKNEAKSQHEIIIVPILDYLHDKKNVSKITYSSSIQYKYEII